MPWTTSDAEHFVKFARRMALPTDDAIRQLMKRMSPGVCDAADRTARFPGFVDARVRKAVAPHGKRRAA